MSFPNNEIALKLSLDIVALNINNNAIMHTYTFPSTRILSASCN